MLHQTFCHIPGIGMKTERKLWEAGITSWEQWQTLPPIQLSAICQDGGDQGTAKLSGRP